MPTALRVIAGVALLLFGFLGMTLAMIGYTILTTQELAWRQPQVVALLITLGLLVLVVLPTPIVIAAAVEVLRRASFRSRALVIAVRIALLVIAAVSIAAGIAIGFTPAVLLTVIGVVPAVIAWVWRAATSRTPRSVPG